VEPHRDLGSGTERFRPSIEEGPAEYFRKAIAFTREFYREELERISSVSLDSVTPEFFFREYMWVVHATGFSAKAVGKFMPRLSQAYGHWADLGLESFETAMERVRPVCNNPQKAKAVHRTALWMCESLQKEEWSTVRDRDLSRTDSLAKLPYVGKITCMHLGRNIGLLECVKPDLHLVRMAEHWGFPDCETMCRSMREACGESVPLGIVDLALWYSASTFGTIGIKTVR
jgi:endonuclease III